MLQSRHSRNALVLDGAIRAENGVPADQREHRGAHRGHLPVGDVLHAGVSAAVSKCQEWPPPLLGAWQRQPALRTLEMPLQSRRGGICRGICMMPHPLAAAFATFALKRFVSLNDPAEALPFGTEQRRQDPHPPTPDGVPGYAELRGEPPARGGLVRGNVPDHSQEQSGSMNALQDRAGQATGCPQAASASATL